MTRKCTLKDVAQHAGVSYQTVSESSAARNKADSMNSTAQFSCSLCRRWMLALAAILIAFGIVTPHLPTRRPSANAQFGLKPCLGKPNSVAKITLWSRLATTLGVLLGSEGIG